MAEAILTLSHRTNADHTADDFTVGQRVKAHLATDTFMRGDVYGTIDLISRGPGRPSSPPRSPTVRWSACIARGAISKL